MLLLGVLLIAGGAKLGNYLGGLIGSGLAGAAVGGGLGILLSYSISLICRD